jgi:glycosyltransferase involved in cell wall biosynthesis
MKILYTLAYEFFPDHRLMKEIHLAKQLGYEIIVVLWQRSDHFKVKADLDGVTVVPLRLPASYGMSAGKHSILQPRFWIKLYKKIREFKPDLIVSHNFDTVPPAFLNKLLGGCDYLYVSREPYHHIVKSKAGSTFLEGLTWILDAFFARFAKETITVTPEMINLYRRMGVTPVFIPNVPTKDFYSHEIKKLDDGICTFGFVGYLRSGLGIEKTWNALLYLRNRGLMNLRLLLCGDIISEFKPQIIRMKSEAADMIDIRQPIFYQGVPELYKEIDIAIYLQDSIAKYHKYGFGVKVMDAMATGTAVVVNNVGENCTLIEHSGGGVIVESDEVEELAHVFKKLCLDGEKRNELGKKGRTFIVDNFNWEMFSEAYLRAIAITK